MLSSPVVVGPLSLISMRKASMRSLGWSFGRLVSCSAISEPMKPQSFRKFDMSSLNPVNSGITKRRKGICDITPPTVSVNLRLFSHEYKSIIIYR